MPTAIRQAQSRLTREDCARPGGDRSTAGHWRRASMDVPIHPPFDTPRSTRKCHSITTSHSAGPACGSARSRLARSEEHTSELQSRQYLVCRLLLEKKKKKI